MGSDNQGEQRAFRVAIMVIMVTLFGVLAYKGWLDDVGRFVTGLFK